MAQRQENKGGRGGGGWGIKQGEGEGEATRGQREARWLSPPAREAINRERETEKRRGSCWGTMNFSLSPPTLLAKGARRSFLRAQRARANANSVATPGGTRHGRYRYCRSKSRSADAGECMDRSETQSPRSTVHTAVSNVLH